MSEENRDLYEQAQRRAKYVARRRAGQTPAERLALLAGLQAASFRLLRSSPQGYEHFLRRNFHSRRAEVIDGQWRPVSPDRSAPPA